jgi:RNA polymerase sigma-70 factor (ECF subfamily)
MNENLLLEKLKKGEKEAWDYFFNKHKPALRYFISKKVYDYSDAEDITIETFTKAFTNIHKFTPKYKLSTWLFSIAKNLVIDHARGKNYMPSNFARLDYDNNFKEYFVSDLVTADEQLIEKEKMKYFYDAIKKLKLKYSMPIELFIDGYSYEEISKQLKIPIGTTKAVLFRAKEMLRKKLKNLDEVKIKKSEELFITKELIEKSKRTKTIKKEKRLKINEKRSNKTKNKRKNNKTSNLKVHR